MILKLFYTFAKKPKVTIQNFKKLITEIKKEILKTYS